MRAALHISGLLLLLAQTETPAPPAIVPGGIVNAASLMPATLPGGALAPGTRILIPGVRLGPAAAAEAAESAAPVELGGVSVRLTQGSRSFSLPIFLASERRIETLIPAGAQPGGAQLTVSYRGLTSQPYSMNFVRSSPGLFAPNPPLDAVPGATIAFRVTGFSAPPEVFLAGRPTPSKFDRQELTVQIPPDSPLGCAVPVVARTPEGTVSNALAVAIHPPGQPCRDHVDWLRGAFEHATRAGYALLARVRIAMPVPPRYQVDYALAGFSRQQSGRRLLPPLPPYGACTQFTARLNLRVLLAQARTPSEWTSIPEKTPGSRRLDAGPEISISGPLGERALKLDPRRPETYSAILGGAPPYFHRPPLPEFLTPGLYTVAAPGGADIAPFRVQLRVPPALEWTNRDTLDTVDRTRGVTVKWKAARRDSAILILAANADDFSGDSAACLCMAPARAGRFTVPPLALSNLPPTTTKTERSASYLLLLEMPAAEPTRIEADGLDAGFAAFVSASAYAVWFK